ncbi:MAG: AraC family transcriptional regulator, partial [Bacteroidota bacterium]
CARLVWGYYPVTPLSAITIGCTILLMAGGGILQQDLRQITAVLPSTDDDTAPVDPALVERVQTLMREKAFFLQQELSLKDFATEVERPTREVSRAINQGLGVSFLDFVNRYRVDHCKELLRQEQFDHLSLLGIALDSGFNSKSTFNRVFKKFAGVSPSEYRKAAQNT